MKKKIRTMLTKMKTFAMLTVAAIGMTVVGFASEPPASSFNLTEIMTNAAKTIVTDLMGMIAGVLPVTITLMAMSIGIAYGIKFIKKITSKAG